MGKWTRWLVFWTCALVLVAFVSAVISYFQWYELQKTSKQTEDAITTSKQIAVAAQNQARTIQDQEIRSLRAYVGVPPNSLKLNCEECGINSKVTNIIPLRNQLNLELRNYGQTPAYNPWICGGFFKGGEDGKVAPNAAENMFVGCDKQFNKFDTMPMIGPNETRFHMVPINRTGVKDISESVANKTYIFFIGRIQFTDAFKNNRTTYICFSYIHDTDGLAFRGCSDHNGPDD